jgi:hypothetical protein
LETSALVVSPEQGTGKSFQYSAPPVIRAPMRLPDDQLVLLAEIIRRQAE